MISKQVIDEIREKADIVQFLESHGVTLQVSGASYKGLCPFHSERSPSFNVKPDIQRYHCFGCQESGDIFDLVKHLEQLSFVGAVEYVADELGIQIVNDEEDEKYKQKRRLEQICKLAAEFFRHSFSSLNVQHPAKQNLAVRHLLTFAETDPSIGYAPSGELLKLMYSKGFRTEEIIEAGLAKIVQPHHTGGSVQNAPTGKGELKEVFRNRLIWTIYDIAGKPVGFSGRKVYENDTVSPKYVNSPQTPLYNKSKALLGLNFARKSIVDERSVYVVEGQTDVMAFQAVGIHNVVASCGTAFGKIHAEILERLSATSTKKTEQFKYYFCFDGDAAGIKAAVGVFHKIPEIQLNSYVINLLSPDGKAVDPCDLRKDFGAKALQEAVAAPVSMVEFILKQELNNWDVTTPEGRSGFVNAARPTLSLIKDSIAHDSYLRKISFWTGIPYAQLIDVVKKPNNVPMTVQAPTQPSINGKAGHLSIDEQFYAAMLQYPDLMTKVFDSNDIQMDFFSNSEEAFHMLVELPQDSPLMFYDLKIPEGKETELLQKLCEKFLHIKYLEELDQLNGRIASASNDVNSIMDENMLIGIMQSQSELKKKYRQK